VFIVGLPRSGTTLLLQLITHALDTCFFTNLASRLRVQGIRRPPVIISGWLANTLKLTARHQEGFASYYGHTRGLGRPNDTAMIWKHWFPDGYVKPGELSPQVRHAIYQSIAGTETVFGRPFVDKAAHNSSRIEALADIFPGALFLYCTRSPLAVAQSIFFGRTQKGDSPERWFSTKPKEYPDLARMGLIEQICGQVYYLERNIAESLRLLTPDRILVTDYKDVCHRPQSQINAIAEFMNRHGAPAKQIRPVPASFPYSHTRQVDIAIYESLKGSLERLYGHRIQELDEP
jgi:hypothetical protein